MPTFSSALLPNTSGLTLGSSALRWQPYLTNPDITGTITYAGPLSGITTFSTSGSITTAAQFISTVSTGTAPLVVASTTQVANLNATQLIGATWISPGTIGSTTPSTGAFTTLTATTGTVTTITSTTESHTGQAAPSVSAAGSGRVYFDSTANRYLLSENAGAYRYFGGTLLNQQGPLAAIVGTGADATIFTYTLPANTLLAGKGIKVFAVWKHSTGTANATYKVKLGSTTLNTSGAVNDSSFDSSYSVSIVNAAGVQTSQYMGGVNNLGVATSQTFSINSTSAENTATALALTLTFSVAATDQVTPLFFLVELVN